MENPHREIVALEPGEWVVHRNLANLFPHSDFNCLSILEDVDSIYRINPSV